MKIRKRWIYLGIVIGGIVAIVSACAPPPVEVFLSPNPEFETYQQSQASPFLQPQSVVVTPQASQPIPTTPQAVQPQTVQPQNEQILTQMLASLAEAQAHMHAGEARLQENNILEAIRELELARRLVEEDFDPSFQYLQQLPKVQGGMSILSDQRIQNIRTQRSDILSRINQAYDFQTLYQRQEQANRINLLRSQNRVTTEPLSMAAVPPPPISDYEKEVNRYIERIQRRGHEFSEFLLRADQYFPTVTSVLSSNGVPTDLAYVALIESGYRPALAGPQGKVGIWQLSDTIGRQYGLVINSQKDERTDIEASTRAFAKYIASLYTRYGSWDLAVLAFDLGPQRVQQAINRASSYQVEEVIQQLGNDAALLYMRDAAMIIAQNPQAYGLQVQLPTIAGPVAVQTRQPVEKVIMETPSVLSLPTSP